MTKQTLLRYFRDFFCFHNSDNKDYKGIDDLFNEWYMARIKYLEQEEGQKVKNECTSKESPDGNHHATTTDPTDGYFCKYCGTELFPPE